MIIQFRNLPRTQIPIGMSAPSKADVYKRQAANSVNADMMSVTQIHQKLEKGYADIEKGNVEDAALSLIHISKTKIHLFNYIESRTANNIALFVSLNKPHSRLTESGVELRLREMGKKLGCLLYTSRCV